LKHMTPFLNSIKYFNLFKNYININLKSFIIYLVFTSS